MFIFLLEHPLGFFWIFLLIWPLNDESFDTSSSESSP